MLRQLWDAWRGKDTLGRMIDLLDQMLAHDQWMFEQATSAYWRRCPWTDVQDALYARDKQVNDLERTIRHEVLRHLTQHAGYDVVACLVLMSVVKDAERAGDYCKNIFEISKMFAHDYRSAQYVEPLKEIHGSVTALFDRTSKAFRESDVDAGREVIRTFRLVGKRCDFLVEQLLRQKDAMSTDEAVSYGLLCRYMKRIAAHLSNIASSVVTPIENLDFMDESRAPGEGEP